MAYNVIVAFLERMGFDGNFTNVQLV